MSREFTQHHGHQSPCRVTRRRLLEVGSSAAFGVTLTDLLAAAEVQTGLSGEARFGQAKSVVVIFLWGGPGQQDLWDPKPAAPSILRGEFQPISTSVAGTQISEQLPKLAEQAHRYTLVRSVTHRDFEHGSAAYTALTGYPHPFPGTNTTAQPDDFPTYGSMVSRLAPATRPVPDFVVLGPVMHQGARPPLAGQNAGFLGPGFDALRVPDDPGERSFRVDGVTLPEDVEQSRLTGRRQLLASIESAERTGMHRQLSGFGDLYDRAFGLLGSSDTRRAFDLAGESQPLRDSYTRTRFGQTLLMARRLVEAHIPLITVNWSKLNADQWDTHSRNYSRLRKMLPPFDQALATFLEDLDTRGLLDSTLVVMLSEFGRTPKINKDAGRDHWPDCYSMLLAGGGISRGKTYGESNRSAAYPIANDVAPWDIAATMFHLKGIDPRTHINNRQGQPLPISRGEVVRGLL
ncbi:MAG: DUF1501 domain-containing protein [Planctomycetota bacterium]|nr:DUF1501 domain-containing protein [Planctomycetota bacterium]